MSRFVSVCLVFFGLALSTPAFATMRYLNQVMEWSCKYCHTAVEGIRSQDSALPAAERFKLNAIGLALFNDPAAYSLLKSRGASHAIRWYNKPWLTKPR